MTTEALQEALAKEQRTSAFLRNQVGEDYNLLLAIADAVGYPLHGQYGQPLRLLPEWLWSKNIGPKQT